MCIKICILDSGVNKYANEFFDCLEGYSLSVEDGRGIVHKNFEDEIGLGTAVYYLLKKALYSVKNGVKVVNVKIFFKDKQIYYNELVKILEFLYRNDSFDFINISSGLVQCGEVSELQKICNAFKNKGCTIVAAYDNEGAISFPAALSNVIGVDGDAESDDGIVYKSSGIVDILCKSGYMRVPGKDGKITVVKGNSYLCPIVTAELVRKKLHGEFIKTNQNKQICRSSNKQILPNLGKCIVFPFNKEIHAIACNEDIVKANIVGYCSHRYSGIIGRKISEVIRWCNNDKIICDIDKVCWESFDSIILGHVGELERLTKRNFQEYILHQAKTRGKKVYSFDRPNNNEYSDVCYYPYIDEKDVSNNYGKIYKTNIPILSIIGTSSKQGKFTLQLNLKRKFQQVGYKIGQLGTEPSALLFGMDCVFPCGYNSSVKLNIYDTIAKINQMIYNMSQNGVDIIITGSQNALVTYNDNNIANYPIYHQIVLQAIKPDAIIICINPFDTVEYIKQTISAAESLTEGKVIAACCFPYDYDDRWEDIREKRIRMSSEKIAEKKAEIREAANIDMYMLDDPADQEKLFECIISFFS